MTILFFDTETTGIPLNGVDIEDPRQPRIVQLAAELTDWITARFVESD